MNTRTTIVIASLIYAMTVGGFIIALRDATRKLKEERRLRQEQCISRTEYDAVLNESQSAHRQLNAALELAESVRARADMRDKLINQSRISNEKTIRNLGDYNDRQLDSLITKLRGEEAQGAAGD